MPLIRDLIKMNNRQEDEISMFSQETDFEKFITCEANNDNEQASTSKGYDIGPPIMRPVKNNKSTRDRSEDEATHKNRKQDMIYEKVANCESKANKVYIDNYLKNNLHKLTKMERIKTESTISIKTDNLAIDKNKIMDTIKDTCKPHRISLPITWDNRRDTIFAQFINQEQKMRLIKSIRTNKTNPLYNMIVKIKEETGHYNKPPVKMEIANIDQNIDERQIEATLKAAINTDCYISNLKSGKVHGQKQLKSISFTMDATGIKKLTEKTRWTIPYVDERSMKRTNLFIKINCKPWLCKDCLGIHNKERCPGKICTRCSKKGHNSIECSSPTKYCKNCNEPGHSPKETHCTFYLNQLVKNLTRVDIPSNTWDSNRLLLDTIENIQLK